MIERELGARLQQLAGWYPVVSVTGPRQSGKSTLVKHVFEDYRYVNLEDPATRSRALTDPTGFIASLPRRAIIDEAQYAPELFSAIQVRADSEGTNGQFILSGSQNFLLLQRIKQSLAGRVGIAYLLPLSYSELVRSEGPRDPFRLMVRGSYPALHISDIPTHIFYENYLDTYVTRDVLGYLNVRNERAFRHFLTACASRSGSLVNFADLARDVDVSVPTAKAWLSILESSFVVHLLPAYSNNITKRLTKTAKLYFCDTGLLCHLLGIDDDTRLTESAALGQVFENYVISERIKARHNDLQRPELFYYRDDSKREVDLIDLADRRAPLVCEIKAGRTYRTSFSRHLAPVADTLRMEHARLQVVYGGDGSFADGQVSVQGIREWLSEEGTC